MLCYISALKISFQLERVGVLESKNRVYNGPEIVYIMVQKCCLKIKLGSNKWKILVAHFLVAH